MLRSHLEKCEPPIMDGLLPRESEVSLTKIEQRMTQLCVQCSSTRVLNKVIGRNSMRGWALATTSTYS